MTGCEPLTQRRDRFAGALCRRAQVEHERVQRLHPQVVGLSQRRRLAYTSIAYTDRLDELDASPSIGTIGDSFDNAMAESVNALYKTELHRNPAALATNGGPWRGLDDLEVATCGWVGWFNDERLHGELDDHTPAEIEAAYYRDLAQAHAA